MTNLPGKDLTRPTPDKVRVSPDSEEHLEGVISGSVERTVSAIPTIAPEVFRRYEEAEKGLGHRVLKMVDAESEHRRTMQRADLDAQIRIAEHPHKLAKRAQWFGIAALVGVLLFAFVVLKTIPGDGGTEVAKASVITALVVVGVAFVGGKAAEVLRARFQKNAEPPKAD